MRILSAEIVHLLHALPHGALATHSLTCPGFPYATALPFVPDAFQRPVFLISGLAEHTRNLDADPRSSLLVGPPSGDDAQTGERMTLVGETRAIDAGDAATRRYLRYLPQAEPYLDLGDFRFFRMEPTDIRLIAGFGRMGWRRDAPFDNAPALDENREETLIASLAPGLRADTRLLGIDPWGIDLEREGCRLRIRFDSQAEPEEVDIVARRALDRLPR
ncbi:HugZ family pyridoxamine 5'-phosphate oxidase [Paludibacterium paludis]|uniref:Pyridoxamine 5'-phosphate oxidase n=1 Tax=Paludibacterium paludis TaxID=1225769 RepID=A0A918U9I4_9NEIS|nr:pyridoxamine 5'-phosphate oxidase family protein [Paludibacterium paludis]GGY13470.1 pyridoxamine 5'-phosphate oxidase [Paludibacterium paludis]